jgi:hypothetical protein
VKFSFRYIQIIIIFFAKSSGVGLIVKDTCNSKKKTLASSRQKAQTSNMMIVLFHMEVHAGVMGALAFTSGFL